MAFSRNRYVRRNAKLLASIVYEQNTNLRLMHLYYFIVSSECWNQSLLSGYVYFWNSFGPCIKKLFSFCWHSEHIYFRVCSSVIGLLIPDGQKRKMGGCFNITEEHLKIPKLYLKRFQKWVFTSWNKNQPDWAHVTYPDSLSQIPCEELSVKVERCISRLQNFKVLNFLGVHEFWILRVSSNYVRITLQIN